jgi:signal transduction histidine kinase/ligand-binding sensor domain-containing protein
MCIMTRAQYALGMLLALSPCAFALNPELDVSQYAHTPWKIRDGFTRGIIETIAQTPDGYLWLGTEFGLLRFDGIKPVPWRPPPDQSGNEQRLPSDHITRLLTARDGTLWIGTSDGLASWNNGRLTLYPDLAGSLILALLEDREGSIWASALKVPVGKLCEIRNANIHCYGDDGRFGSGVLGLHEDGMGILWAGVRTGVWRWKPDPPKFIPLRGDLSSTALGEGDNGAVLIGRRGGIRRLVEGKTEAYRLPGTSGTVEALSFLRDRDGGLWIATFDRGLVHVHQGRTDSFTLSDGLSGDDVPALYEDREGNIWVSTNNGLDRFREFAVNTFSAKEGLPDARHRAVLAAGDGSIWLGTAAGLGKLSQGEATIYRQPTGEPPESLFLEGRGRIWVSTRTGVGYFENGHFVPVGAVPRGFVNSMAEDARDNLWIANQDRGLFKVSPDQDVQQISWTTLGHKDHAYALAADPMQGLWLGFYNGGIAWFRDGQVRAAYSAADGLAEGRVNDLRFDKEDALWAATEGGLSRLKYGHIATLTAKNGLPCEGVQWTLEDNARSVWMLTPCGLVLVARAELDAWAGSAPPSRAGLKVLDSSDGVRSDVALSTFTPHVAKSPDGKLWFTTPDGLSVLDPRHLPFNKLPPPVHIETVKINGKERAPDEGLELSHTSNDLEIDYTALSFTNPDRVLYKYKLEGKDADWQDVGTQRYANYGGLPPKKYRFRVMASNNDGVWNEAGAEWNFSITPAYYQTIWFSSLLVLAVAGLLWLLHRLRLRQIAARLNLVHTGRLEERTRIARDLHDTLLQSLAGVSLQLDGVSKQAARAGVPENALSMIGRIREQVDSAFREARGKVWGLRSPELKDQGLAGALRQFVERAQPSTTARYDFTVSGEPLPCSPEVEEELLRIAQEAANNAIRHAQPNVIRITLVYGVNSLTLSIADDGRGFHLEEGLQKSGHWGLKNMQERAAQIGGTCKFSTGVGRSTQVEVRVPLSSWSLRNTFAKHAHSSSGSR